VNYLALHALPIDPQAVMDQHAKSFSWAARLLSAKARRDAALLYAYARAADDFADEIELGSLEQRSRALQEMRSGALRAEAGPKSLAEESLAVQTGLMLRNHSIPASVLEKFMDSLQADTNARHIQNTEDLLHFAYGVAGTVGQMMRPLLGAAPAADPYAIALGIAMQLTNIARDVVEDAHRQRCYIPAQWGVSLRLMAAPSNTSEKSMAFTALQRLLALSDDFYAYAHSGFAAIPSQNRRAIRTAAALYQGIGKKILQRGPERYWDERVYLTRAEKMKTLVQVLFFVSNPAGCAVRDVWRDDLLHLVGIHGFPAVH
jgi:phytoene synthase